jgi:hypothetical protein
LKIVDFVIGNLLVEVTGYAYSAWRQQFDVKIQLLAKSYPNKQILIVSQNDEWRGDQLRELSKHKSSQIEVMDLTEEQSLCDYIIANR